MATNNQSSETLITYPISDDESIVDGVIHAFESLEMDLYTKPTVLNDWVHCDCLEQMYWDSNDFLQLSTRIWDHPTTITADTVTIYAAESER